MLAITDTRFARALLACAQRALKLPVGEGLPAGRENSPEAIRRKLRPFREAGLLTDYPLGCDFTPVEQRLAKALGWLKAATATRAGKARTLLQAVTSGGRDDAEAMARMHLANPRGFAERMQARLLRLALSKVGSEP
jgi:hypothetical protein